MVTRKTTGTPIIPARGNLQAPKRTVTGGVTGPKPQPVTRGGGSQGGGNGGSKGGGSK